MKRKLNPRLGVGLFGALAATALALSLMSGSDPELSAQNTKKLWVERSDANRTRLVNLPNFVPLVTEVDRSVVNIATTTKPKPRDRERMMRRGPGQGQQPRNPFGPDMPFGPEEFFERFFGQPMEPRAIPRRSLGSGFIISAEGHILTNNHVIEGADTIEVRLFEENRSSTNPKENVYKAKIIGRDPMTDVALIKIDGSGFKPLPLGDSDKLQKGEWTVAIGNPLGLDHTVTAGIVSAKGREINANPNRARFDDFIQTDAAINFGNSGGPLINLSGEAVGINTAITAVGSGIGFAVPISIAKRVIPLLMEKGFVSRGYLGVGIADLTKETIEALGLKVQEGVLIQNVVENGPAAGSGLNRQDIVVAFNDKPVKNVRELQNFVAETKPGTAVKLTVLRDGKKRDVTFKVGQLPTDESQTPSPDSDEKEDLLGLTVRPVPDGTGVEIVGMSEDSPLIEKGIRPGFVIQSILVKGRRSSIKGVAEYQTALKSVKPGTAVALDVRDPEGREVIVDVRIPKSE